MKNIKIYYHVMIVFLLTFISVIAIASYLKTKNKKQDGFFLSCNESRYL